MVTHLWVKISSKLNTEEAASLSAETFRGKSGLLGWQIFNFYPSD